MYLSGPFVIKGVASHVPGVFHTGRMLEAPVIGCEYELACRRPCYLQFHDSRGCTKGNIDIANLVICPGQVMEIYIFVKDFSTSWQCGAIFITCCN